MNEEKLSERKKEILLKSIEDYIESASPITSGAVHDNHLKNISPATLRNELNALEAMGYLKQIHTSSGRIPTSKAYRFFVNEIMKTTKFDKKSLATVREIFSQRSESLTEIVNQLAGIISEATNYPTFVVLNSYKGLIVENIKIIKLIDGNAIVLIGTKSGIINNSMTLPKETSEESCFDASNFLTNHFKGKTIADMIENLPKYLTEMQTDLNMFTGIFDNLMKCLENLTNGKSNVVHAGTTKLLNNPEYSNVEKAKKVLNFMENEKEIESVFNSTNEDEDISFKIGNENEREELENCSVIKAEYRIKGNTIASIGVIGPERMDYGKTAGALKFIVEELNKIYMLESPDSKEGGKNE
ncbi:MAG: heat-inducible transcription repressor HrcA [Clostridiales bacterium]|nr:heat-inducible transcription repressor HrcA [Candidatus Apopatousia equi]